MPFCEYLRILLLDDFECEGRKYTQGNAPFLCRRFAVPLLIGRFRERLDDQVVRKADRRRIFIGFQHERQAFRNDGHVLKAHAGGRFAKLQLNIPEH